jgi:hypothetical protein
MIKKYFYASDEHSRITEIYEYSGELLPQYSHYLTGEFEDSIVARIMIGEDAIIDNKLVHIGILESEKNEFERTLKIERFYELKKFLTDTDWKIIVNNELIHAGLSPKYDAILLHEERQRARDEINELEKLL